MKEKIWWEAVYVWKKTKRNKLHHYYRDGEKKTLCGISLENYGVHIIGQKESIVCVKCLDFRIENLILLREKVNKEQ